MEGVRSYKRVSAEQRLALSEVLNSATNGNKESLAPDVKKPHHETLKQSVVSLASGKAGGSSESIVPSLNFSGCSQITINYTPYKPQ